MQRSHPPLDLLLRQSVLPETSKTQFLMYIVAVSTGEPVSCLRTEQVYHKSAFAALQCCKERLSIESGRRDLRRSPIPPRR